ncbi:MAG: hypothetical protein U0R26_11890 [Solirubrobacterales bacterium]
MGGNKYSEACPLCGARFSSYAELEAHQDLYHSHEDTAEDGGQEAPHPAPRELTRPGQEECLLCGARFDSKPELYAHHEMVHEVRAKGDEFSWGGCLLAIPALLVAAWRWIVGVFFVVAVCLGALGVFDKTKTADTTSCPGYGFVRDMEERGVIESFDRVEPESGWICEYSLNDEQAYVRFKKAGRELELEVAGRGQAYEAADEEAERKGFKSK